MLSYGCRNKYHSLSLQHELSPPPFWTSGEQIEVLAGLYSFWRPGEDPCPWLFRFVEAAGPSLAGGPSSISQVCDSHVTAPFPRFAPLATLCHSIVMTMGLPPVSRTIS